MLQKLGTVMSTMLWWTLERMPLYCLCILGWEGDIAECQVPSATVTGPIVQVYEFNGL